MIRLRFAGVSSDQDAQLGPAPGFRVGGNFIRKLPSGEIVAYYVRHQWQIGEVFFSRYECRDPCFVHMEDAQGARTAPLGPFKEIFVADGIMYADQELFAKHVEETLNWHCYPLQTYWPALVLVAVGAQA